MRPELMPKVERMLGRAKSRNHPHTPQRMVVIQQGMGRSDHDPSNSSPVPTTGPCPKLQGTALIQLLFDMKTYTMLCVKEVEERKTACGEQRQKYRTTMFTLEKSRGTKG